MFDPIWPHYLQLIERYKSRSPYKGRVASEKLELKILIWTKFYGDKGGVW